MVSIATYDASIFQPALAHGILYSQNGLGDNATSFMFLSNTFEAF
jgi:hypothetical protein